MVEKTFQQDNVGRIRAFQGARFLFVVLIYISHCVTPRTLQPFDFGGELGVSFFFMLSGFVLSWGDGPRVSRGDFKPKSFFWRHFWRFYPLHLLLVAVMLVFDWRIGKAYDWMQLISSLLLLQSWIPSNHTLYSVNAVSWFLCDVIFFYAIFRWLYTWIMQSRGLWWKFLIFAVVYCIVAWHVPKDMVNCTLYANPLLRSVDFGLGIVAYRLCKTDRFLTCNCCKGSFQLLMWLPVFWVLYSVYQMLDGNGVRCAAVFWPFVPVLVADIAASDGTSDFAARLLASRPMAWLGGISFEFFMAHPLAMRLTQHFMGLDGSPEDDMKYFCMAFLVAVLMAWMLNSWFVKPVGNTINRHFLPS